MTQNLNQSVFLLRISQQCIEDILEILFNKGHIFDLYRIKCYELIRFGNLLAITSFMIKEEGRSLSIFTNLISQVILCGLVLVTDSVEINYLRLAAH